MLELGELVTDLLGHGHPSVQAAGFVFCCGLEMGNHFFFFSVPDARSCVSVPACLLESVYGEAKCRQGAWEQSL